MPQYKAIRGIRITTKPLIKTTTNKIKRQANLDEIKKSNKKIHVYKKQAENLGPACFSMLIRHSRLARESCAPRAYPTTEVTGIAR